MARIGIDLDGVAYPFAEEIQAYASKQLGVSLPPFTHWNTHQKQWGLSHEQLRYLMVEALTEGHLWHSGVPAQGFTAALWALADAGHRVVIATDRLQDTRHARLAMSVTREWLRSTGANYDELLFTSDKRDANCDIFIDDRPQAVPLLRLNGVDAIYMDQPWNAQFPYPRVRSWAEFVEYVEEKTHVSAE